MYYSSNEVHTFHEVFRLKLLIELDFKLSKEGIVKI